MVWIVTGAHGQLGTALCRLAPERMLGLTHAELDITNRKQLQEILDRLQPKGVINTAAYNFVDKAETDATSAFHINATGPQVLSQECQSRNLPLVQISTDYVFCDAAEKGGGFSETDLPVLKGDPPPRRGMHPLNTWRGDLPLVQMKTDLALPEPPKKVPNFSESLLEYRTKVYAQTKLFGEVVVRLYCKRYFIVRTCGIYGLAQTAGKGNFVKTMLRLGREKGEVKVVTDQRCTPTSAVDLATGILKLIDTEAYGLYHLTNSGSCTWFEFAAEIFRQSGLDVKMTGITTEEYGAAAPRPKFSVLDCRKFIQTTGWEPPSWQDALGRYLAERSL